MSSGVLSRGTTLSQDEIFSNFQEAFSGTFENQCEVLKIYELLLRHRNEIEGVIVDVVI